MIHRHSNFRISVLRCFGVALRQGYFYSYLESIFEILLWEDLRLEMVE
jgi:hypothetical protein